MSICFKDYHISQEIEGLNYQKPTEVQAKVIPQH